MLRLSMGRIIDGLWVGSYYQSNADVVLRRVEDALAIVRRYDGLRYARVLRDLDRIWIRLLPTGAAQYSPVLRACVLDERFVLANTTDSELIAAVIVHEATHARLWETGFRYEEVIRERIEAVCFRRELAFARDLPNGDRVKQWTEAAMLEPGDYWTDASSSDRERDGATEVLRHLSSSNWLARLALALFNRRKTGPR